MFSLASLGRWVDGALAVCNCGLFVTDQLCRLGTGGVDECAVRDQVGGCEGGQPGCHCSATLSGKGTVTVGL
jgi:hypothetical protein